ncbi:D-alanyl-D-alanine carboxypeptidase family protein [Streptomonospora nanhaiensis]|uniref:LAS superfamily LD-carboxypeptidase LdcB n=1 Tax=Streptomonospora nanhaiensis TaxID=1323731 RepID=A0A853BPC1_9ACTN|nr:M15 family metallopeptidase [Streptomonospora nanhaiensis]MBV2366089.1 M15 family metallopeptidase [Streptomonospora nanhaiensis]MBX9388877.1 M15 family metallopeptidase [Streptomonospora nanhaiensis]NYI96565.1 LAS superfamily LD-carboxypeptidase LdcB [Streptomonospora nanhaiensis]
MFGRRRRAESRPARRRWRRRGDGGATRADYSIAGVSLSVSGILSYVFVQAMTGSTPFAEDQQAGTDQVNFSTAAAGDCDRGSVQQAEGYDNGRIPTEALCELTEEGQYLRADAAVAFLAMNERYRDEFGEDICITDAYRSFADQQRLYDAYVNGNGNLAARPGSSNHGEGLAVDLCGGVENFGTEQHEWMRANANDFNWFHPTWAQEGKSTSEAWHWEYTNAIQA